MRLSTVVFVKISSWFLAFICYVLSCQEISKNMFRLIINYWLFVLKYWYWIYIYFVEHIYIYIYSMLGFVCIEYLQWPFKVPICSRCWHCWVQCFVRWKSRLTNCQWWQDQLWRSTGWSVLIVEIHSHVSKYLLFISDFISNMLAESKQNDPLFILL